MRKYYINFIGIFTKSERIAYVTQTAWIQHKSIRENILFGQPFDSLRYSSVIDACALQTDFQSLPDADYTEVSSSYSIKTKIKNIDFTS